VKALALARLLQIASQALPIGGYSHSQGLESAAEHRVVLDEATALRWIADVLEYSMLSFEIPMLLMMAGAWEGDSDARTTAVVRTLNEEFLATRESAELRAASVQMGYSMMALVQVLPDFPADILERLRSIAEPSLPCVWSAASAAWHIGTSESALAYAWSWSENQVLAAIKTVPLGQSSGQRMLLEIGTRLAAAFDRDAAAARDPTNHADRRSDRRSNFSPALAILSSQHETQYSRLFRS